MLNKILLKTTYLCICVPICVPNIWSLVFPSQGNCLQSRQTLSVESLSVRELIRRNETTKLTQTKTSN